MDITLVIPTYNEAGNIPILVEKVFRIFSCKKLDGKIIIVDDDSPDQTWKVAENLKDKYPNLDVLRRLEKRGLSSAVLDGFALANTEIVGVIDADLSHLRRRFRNWLRLLSKGRRILLWGADI